MPINPALRNKHVSFLLQGNNTDKDDTVPDKLNVKIDHWDPARDYHVIPEASKSWNLAMEEYRSAARDHSCLCRLTDAQINKRPDLWMYGLSPAPDHMKPLSSEIISNIIHEASKKILDVTVSTLRTRMDRAQKQGERHVGPTKQDYDDAGNPDYQIAEHRLLGIVGHYRIKEKDTQAKITSDEHSRRPTDPTTWSRDLAHRRV